MSERPTLSGSQAVVIVNPKSQNGALGERWPELARILHREYGPFEHVMTHHPGDATRLAREAIRSGADLVVAVGGDGTIHEVANGFFDERGRPTSPRTEAGAEGRSRAALGILPYGTGGDFRKTIRVPKNMEYAARILRLGVRRPIDMGLLEYAEGGRGGRRASRVFINLASFGIGGLIDRIVNSSSKALGGAFSFFLGTARATMSYQNQHVRIVFDGDENDMLDATVNSVLVANGRYCGGGMFVAPQAELDDGKFDVVVMGDLSKLDVIKNGHHVYKGTHLTLPKVSFRRATRVDAVAVNGSDEVLLDVDGETPGALPATFTLLPQALPVVMPL
jgi:YegS/Rv2252/BmrU family lipid kinase